MKTTEPTVEETLRMRLALLEEQNAGMFEANYNLHMENARLQKLIAIHCATMLPKLAQLKELP